MRMVTAHGTGEKWPWRSGAARPSLVLIGRVVAMLQAEQATAQTMQPDRARHDGDLNRCEAVSIITARTGRKARILITLSASAESAWADH